MSFDQWALALCALVALGLSALALRPPSAATLRRHGQEFALRHRLRVEQGDTAVIDEVTAWDRRAGLVAMAAIFVVLVPGIILLDDDDLGTGTASAWAVVLLVASAQIGVPLLRARATSVHDSVSVPVSDFVHPAARVTNAVVGVTGAALTTWVVVAPSRYAGPSTLAAAATPLVCAALVELAAHLLARRSTSPTRWIAFAQDARTSDLIAATYRNIPLVYVIASGFALSGQLVSEGAEVVFYAGLGIMAVSAVMAFRAKHRFRSRLWPQLAPGEIVSSATP